MLKWRNRMMFNCWTSFSPKFLWCLENVWAVSWCSRVVDLTLSLEVSWRLDNVEWWLAIGIGCVVWSVTKLLDLFDLLGCVDANIDHLLCKVDSLLLIFIVISTQSTLLEPVFVVTEGLLDEETELIFLYKSLIISCKVLNFVKVSSSCFSNSGHFKHLYSWRKSSFWAKWTDLMLDLIELPAVMGIWMFWRKENLHVSTHAHARNENYWLYHPISPRQCEMVMQWRLDSWKADSL